MSIVDRNKIDSIMSRIEVATRNSPIAVFQHTTVNDDGTETADFEQLFASTTGTQGRIKLNPVGLVGVFCQEMGLEKIKSFFENYESHPVWDKLGIA